MQVQDGSPGHKAGLEAFFDFIVAIGNTRLVSSRFRINALSTVTRVRLCIRLCKTCYYERTDYKMLSARHLLSACLIMYHMN